MSRSKISNDTEVKIIQNKIQKLVNQSNKQKFINAKLIEEIHLLKH